MARGFLLKAPKFIETVDDYLNYQRPAQRDQFLLALLIAENDSSALIVGGIIRKLLAPVDCRPPEDSGKAPFEQTAAEPEHLRRFRQCFGRDLLRQRTDMARHRLHGRERRSSGDSQPAATDPLAPNGSKTN